MHKRLLLVALVCLPIPAARADGKTREKLTPAQERAAQAEKLRRRDQPLSVGAKAPPVNEKLKGKTAVVVFYRGAWCPSCREQLAQFQDRLDEIENRGAKLMAVSADSATDSKALAARLGLNFPLFSDPTLDIAAKYGVRQTERDIALPALFIIDANGKVRFARIAEHSADRPSVDDVLQALDKLH